MNPYPDLSRKPAAPKSDTMVDAHNKGKQARANGVERLQVLQTNPYRMMDDRWDAWNAGWEGEPCPMSEPPITD